MYGRMYGYMDGWMDGCADERGGCMDVWMELLNYVYMRACGHRDEWVGRW